MTDGLLPMFVVFFQPLDYPHGYTVRRHVVCSGGRIEPDPEPLIHSVSLDEARLAIRRVAGWLVYTPRQPDDDPAVVEVWF